MTTLTDPHHDLHSEAGVLRGEHAGRSSAPVIKVRDLAWLEFEKPDLAAAADFARALGLTVHHRGTDAPALVGATVVRVHPWQMPRPLPAPGIVDAIDAQGQLRDWLRPARSLLVRPDRVVFLSDPTPADIPAFLLPSHTDHLVA